MMRSGFLLLIAACLAACTASAPVANLKYLSMSAVGHSYQLRFSSDQPILELFAKNKHQKPVLTELICSLDDDHNFDIEHRLKYFANGGIERVQETAPAGHSAHVFDATLHFWQSPENEMGSDQSLAKEDLERLFKDRASIVCRVRMTVYLSSPYYSERMLVPTKDILAVAVARPM